MKIKQSPIGVIYRVGDLKAAFTEVKENLSRKYGHGQEVTDLTEVLLTQVATGLGFLRASFNDEDLLALPAIPAEIASATDPLSRPFKDYYLDKQFAIVPSELGLNLKRK